MEATLLGLVSMLGFTSCNRTHTNIEKPVAPNEPARIDTPKLIYGGPAMMGGRVLDEPVPPVPEKEGESEK